MKLSRLALLLACVALPLAAVKAANMDTAAVETAADGSAKAPEGMVEPESPDPPADPAKPWTLPQPQLLQNYGIHMFGWLDQGFTINPQSPADRTNGPVALNDRSNDYQLNQLWLGFERKVKTDGCGFDLGGRIDMSYGTDWRYGDCVGLEQKINDKTDLYGLILPQFYVEAGWNDLTVKAGHYAAGMGYEQVPGPANFFYSHSYAMGYSEVILVTGMQAEYKLTDNWSVNSGFFDGWSGFAGFEDPADKWDYLGGLKWHNDANTTSLSWEITAGPQDPAGIQTLYDYALVFKHQINECLLYVAQQNDGGEANAIPGSSKYAKWYGLDQYLIYTASPKLSYGLRVEFFRDQDGTRVMGVGNLNNGWMGKPGFKGTFAEVTGGVNWRFHPNFVLRPEIRWDTYSGSTNPVGQLPFDNGTRSGQLTMATDLIATF